MIVWVPKSPEGESCPKLCSSSELGADLNLIRELDDRNGWRIVRCEIKEVEE